MGYFFVFVVVVVVVVFAEFVFSSPELRSRLAIVITFCPSSVRASVRPSVR